MSEGFDNPYQEDRAPSPGELDQMYAGFFSMAALFFGLEFTDREKEAIPVVIGAIMRERHKVGLDSILALLKQFT